MTRFGSSKSDNSTDSTRQIIKHLFGISDKFQINDLEVTQGKIKEILEDFFNRSVEHQTINQIIRTSNYSLAWYDYTKKYTNGNTKNFHDKRNKKSKDLMAIRCDGTSPIYEVNHKFKFNKDDRKDLKSDAGIIEHIKEIKELF